MLGRGREKREVSNDSNLGSAHVPVHSPSEGQMHSHMHDVTLNCWTHPSSLLLLYYISTPSQGLLVGKNISAPFILG